ncbi:glycosyltransferase family 87 protein [Pseudarthrobacter sp. N5]|uniref:glycosyltransferase family 87 protein n=1 Tax=Pseudarthrobacter sp. N5 TaxID=3418416 RepID=UPI003CF53398
MNSGIELFSKCNRAGHRFIRAFDRLITKERLRNYPLIFVVLGALGVASSSVSRIVDPTVQGPFLPDYLAHWTGGGLILSGGHGQLYDPAVQHAYQESAIGTTTKLSWFVSPPLVAVLYVPLSLMNYNLSATCWLILTLAMLLWCILSLKSIAPKIMLMKRRTAVLGLLASVPAFELLGGGQDSAFILAVWILGMHFLATRHPLAAGAIFGLGFMKPQHVFLVPFLLLLTRSWKALGAFCAVVVALSAASVGLVGIEGMKEWAAALTSPMYSEQVQLGQAWKMVSLPALIVALIPPDWAAWLSPNLAWASLTLGLGVLLLRLRTLRAPVGVQGFWVCALATTVVFSPHLAVYDAVLMFPVVLYLLEKRSSPRIRVAVVAAFGLMWIAPVLHVGAAMLGGPFTIIDAPYSAIPLTVLWAETLKGLRIRSSDAPDGGIVSSMEPGIFRIGAERRGLLGGPAG